MICSCIYTLTHEIKLQALKGRHPDWDAQFPVPPVHTVYWAEEDWVRWVDNNGHWIRKAE